MNSYTPDNSFTAFPPAIKNLILINLIVYVATRSIFADSWTTFGAMIAPYLALYPIGTPMFEPWQLVTYMFLHGSFGHIFMNLLALWIFGQAIENLWGSRRFVVYYFLTGIGAALIHMWIGSSMGPTIGASGAIYGILLAFGMMYPNRYLLLLFPPIPIKAKYLVTIFGLIALFEGLTSSNSGIAHFAHLGGLIIGFILIKFWKLKAPAEY